MRGGLRYRAMIQTATRWHSGIRFVRASRLELLDVCINQGGASLGNRALLMARGPTLPRSRRRALFVVAVIASAVGAIAGFVLVGHYAARPNAGDFDWALASIFGTAVGTVLLAVSTGALALTTVRDVSATIEMVELTRQELAVAQRSLETATRPVLVDAPYGVFTSESEYVTLKGTERRVVDRGRITVSAGSLGGPTEDDDPVGYIDVAVPLHNVWAGLAMIVSAAISLEIGVLSAWRRTMGQTAVPPHELVTVSFSSSLDLGDAQALEGEFSGYGEAVQRVMQIEVRYTDVSGGQATRTRMTIIGRRNSWRVKEVSLNRDGEELPFLQLDREASTPTWG